MDYHRQASDNVKNNFDKSKLDPNQNYTVNMYYNTSPYMRKFYNEAVKQDTDNYATHVGRLYYDKNQKD